jgi:hypothetical protein
MGCAYGLVLGTVVLASCGEGNDRHVERSDSCRVILSQVIWEATMSTLAELHEFVRELGPRGEEALIIAANGLLAEDRANDQAEGRAQGRAEGRLDGYADAIVRVLGARGLPVTNEQRGRILGCRDPEILNAWLVRSATATSVHDVFVVA